MKKTRHCRWFAFSALVLLLTGLRAEDRTGSFYPLDPGNAWVYRRANDILEGTRWEHHVENRRGEIADVAMRLFSRGELELSFVVSFRDRGNAIDVEIPGEGFQTAYRFKQQSFLHRDPTDRCDDGRELETMLSSATVETPAGVFSDCVLFSFSGGNCADNGTMIERWCRGAGLVSWDDLANDTICFWELISLDRPLFRRGDANADGGLDVSDPIALLSRLFLGEGELSCEDAADTDDNGRLEVTDAISILQHLFVDSSAGLPDPFGPCGPDPRGDGLEVCSYEACE